MNILDMHCDTISAILTRKRQGEACNLKENNLHIDLAKLKVSHYLLQNFALFVDSHAVENPLEEALFLTDLYYQELSENASSIAPVFSYADIEKNKSEGKISSLLTLEEGEILKGELSNLRIFYRLGVRMITLTWNYKNALGYPNLHLKEGQYPEMYVPDTKNGLTKLGIDFLAEMERLGIIIDVSHLSDAGFYDVLNHTKKPFVASHSNARTICPNIRNLTDPMIHCLSERGGITGLNFCPDFLSDDFSGNHSPGTIESIVKHARHIVNTGGIECLALGSDFDGIEGHAELPDASKMMFLIDALKKDGFTQEQLDKILYKNALRVYKEIL